MLGICSTLARNSYPDLVWAKRSIMAERSTGQGEATIELETAAQGRRDSFEGLRDKLYVREYWYVNGGIEASANLLP